MFVEALCRLALPVGLAPALLAATAVAVACVPGIRWPPWDLPTPAWHHSSVCRVVINHDASLGDNYRREIVLSQCWEPV